VQKFNLRHILEQNSHVAKASPADNYAANDIKKNAVPGSVMGYTKK